MSHEHDRVRAMVADSYTDALKGKGGCCGTAEAVPSFGCGNPPAFDRVEKGQTVLDLGSGAGHDLLVAAGRVGPTGRVIGVDMTDAMIEAARRNVATHPNVEVRKGIIEKLPIPDASVDWVISNCVINLSPDKPRVFAEIARVLKPGGRISISDMVAENLPDRVRNDEAYAACIAGAIPESQYVAGLWAAGLTDVTVDERHPYAADELCGVDGSNADLDGKVASIRVHARKP